MPLRLRHQIVLNVKLLLAIVAAATMAGPAALGAAKSVQASPTQSTAFPAWQIAAGSNLSFEVASIRPSKPGVYTPPNFTSEGDNYGVYGDPHGRLSMDFDLADYIEFAYKLWLTSEQKRSMLANLPKWVSAENFEINAKAEGNPTKDQMRLMMQSLLADRFGLRVHFETRTIPVFALELAKHGRTATELRPHVDGSPCYLPTPPTVAGSPPTFGDTSRAPCDWYAWALRFMPEQAMFLLGRDISMKEIAAALPSVGLFERPVVDRTGLQGKFDLTLSLRPDYNAASAPQGAIVTPQGPTFSEAMQDQLGLKLKTTNAPWDVLVIDHVQQPSAN